LDFQKLRELAVLFLRLGATTFGGPAAHIAVMEEEIVRRRGWLERKEFLDLLGATNLIPGPNSTEMAIHIGYRRAGFSGLLVAGASFILPAALLVLALAWAYARYRSIPEVEAILFGVKPVVVAVVIQALSGLARTGIPSVRLFVLAALAVVANGLGLSEILTLLAAGLASAASSPPLRGSMLMLPLVLLPPGAAAVSTGKIFVLFLKVGSVLYGSGYVLLAFLQSDLVERYRWLTETELLDAIAVAQMTPGPVFTVATFIGYLLDGLPGALAATAGIFLPAFFFVAVSGPLVARIRRSKVLSAFLDGVIAASLSLMAVVAFELATGALVNVASWLIFLASAVALLKFRVSSSWCLLVAALVSLIWQTSG
jgi:chromate transporter